MPGLSPRHLADMSVTGDHIENKLRLLTTSQPNFARACISPDTLKTKCPLDDSKALSRLHSAPSSNPQEHDAVRVSATRPRWKSLLDRLCNPTAVLGSMDILPPEVLQGVLYQSDLRSLTNFRAVNERARSLVDTLPRYHAIIEHVPDALRLMLSMRTTSYFTISDLYDALIFQECYACGDFGGFLNGMICRRCCYHCATYSPKLDCLDIDIARIQCLLDQPSVFPLQVVFSVPGKHGSMERPARKPKPLILISSAQQIVSMFREAQANEQIEIANKDTKKAISYLERLLHPPPSFERPEHIIRRPIRCNNPWLFQYITRVPALHPSTGEVEQGLSCQACQTTANGSEKKGTKLFTKDQFLQHFTQCESAQAKWQRYVSLGLC